MDGNETLSEIKKFYYLRSSLVEYAAQIIQSMEVSADNYANVWQMLIDRFENKTLMIHNHVKAIFQSRYK